MKLEQLANVSSEDPLVIVATGKYVGEGFNLPRLDTLFVALPVSWKGIVQQYAGRLHRDYAGKSEVLIYDYVDMHVPLCEVMYSRRLKGYASVGYQIKTDDVLFGVPQPTVNSIYNGLSFLQPFLSELSSAKKSVVIASPKVKLGKRSIVADRLRDIALRGVKVVVFTKDTNDETTYLSSQGITVYQKPKLSLCCAIIDRSTTWYGSINILAYHLEEDCMIRLTDSEIASGLIEGLY